MSRAVLLVDDESNVLQSLRRLLHGDDYELHVADGGAAALEILGKTEVAVVVCDQRMPDVNGAQVLAEAYRLQPDAIRIALTGHTDILTAQASINEGHVSHFLFKPWNDDQLRTLIRQSVEDYRLAHENRRLESLNRRQTAEMMDWNRKLEAVVRKQTEGLRAQNADLLRLHARVGQSLRDTVKLVAGMLEVHSPNLGIHCRRVAEFARQLAIRVGLEGERLRDVEFAAQLHDIGKLSKVAAEAAAQGRASSNPKQQRLPPHTEAGYALLSQVSGFEAIALAVRHLHERFDGAGHPSGLKENGIPLASRIIAVANAYDTAVFSAINPTNVSHHAGVQVLRQGGNSQFDPRLIEPFLQQFDESGASRSQFEVEISSKRIQPGMILSRPVLNMAGMLVLKEGAEMTPELIEGLQKLGDVDPRVASVFIKCNPESDDAPTDRQVVEPRLEIPLTPVAPPQPESGAGGEIAATAPNGAQPQLAPRGQWCKLVVVDDSPLLCNALKRELHGAGIEVLATESGWTALRLIEMTRVDALLIDLMMPAMSGEELVARLERSAPAIPCIILTGNATKDRVLALAKKPNVAGILLKPWDHHRLVSTITSAVAKRRQ